MAFSIFYYFYLLKYIQNNIFTIIIRSSPDSILLSDGQWLLVAWSADFADVGPTLGEHWLLVIWFADFTTIGPTLTHRQLSNHYSGCIYFYILSPLGQRRIFIQDDGQQ